MKRKTLLLSFLLMILGGASSVWAEKFSPTVEIMYGTSNADNNAWHSGYPKVASSDNQVFESNYNVGIVGLQKYTVDDLDNVSSLTLCLTGDKSYGTDALAIWSFPTNDWDENTTPQTLAANVESTVGIPLHATEGSYSSTYLLKDQHTSSTSGTGDEADIRFRYFTISGNALTTLKSRATSNTFTLLITTQTSQLLSGSRRWYSNGHATVKYRPYITASYSNAATIGETRYTTLNAAFDAATSGQTITLNHDITLTDRCNTSTKTITVTPAKDVTVSSTITSKIWILNNQSTGDLTFGSDDHHITIDGGNYSVGYALLAAEHGTTRINNVTFKNCHGTTDNGVVHLKSQNSGATLYLKNVTFNGCTANDGRGIVTVGTNNCHLQNAITFTDCSAGSYNFYLQDRFLRVGDLSTTQVAPFTVYYQTPSLKSVILSRAGGGDVSSLFNLMNDNFGIIKDPGHYTDHKITEAYTMTMNSYGASTLILPYAAKIPTGVTAYTLNYTAGNSSVKATEVTGGTLSANTPVLINGDASTKYWFINTSLVDETTTGSGTHTEGALTGVYATTSVPADSYILWADATHDIGFYKANSSTIAAYRAYLTAEGGAGVKAFTIVYDDETGVDMVQSEGLMNQDSRIFNLAGQRLSKARKGINIVNGKKYVVK